MIEHIQNYISTFVHTLGQFPIEKLDQVIQILHQARLNGQQIFVMGNGGSASTASHIVCDLAKNTYHADLPGFRVIGLSDNMAIFSALANDNGYDNVFSDQIRNLIRPNDVVLAISTSGNSANIIKAVELSNEVGAYTIGFTGFNGGKLGRIVSLEIRVPSENVQQIEDIHLMMEHMITSGLILLAEKTSAIRIEAGLPEQDSLSIAGDLFNVALESTRENSAAAPEDHSTLSQVLQLSIHGTGAMSGTIILLDSDGNIVSGAQLLEGKLLEPPMEQLSEIHRHGLAGWVIKNNIPALIKSTVDDHRWLQRPWELSQKSSRSALSVPFTTQEGILGSITLVHPNVDRFSKEDLEFVSNMAAAFTPIMVSRRR